MSSEQRTQDLSQLNRRQYADFPARASQRLKYPPFYVVVGVYRLVTDKALFVPVWDKCRDGFLRGSVVGLVWAVATFKIQRKFIELFLMHSQQVTGLSHKTLFGYEVPFSLATYAAAIFIGHQVEAILNFFLSRNLSAARVHAWAQTIASRGKGPDFWQPYVEEWERPPIVNEKPLGIIETTLNTWFWRAIVQRAILIHFTLYPFVGIIFKAVFKAFATARSLHIPYFEAKKMTTQQRLVFIEERKWDYRSFGFVAALLEGIPVVGLVFSVSNRIGAAMWAHDLEKQQHFVKAHGEEKRTT